MGTKTHRKILLAVDGSDQALEAIRYAGAVFPPEHTKIVLFNVGIGFQDLISDMDGNPLYQSKKGKVMGWLADNQLTMGEFREIALKTLSDAGFDSDAVEVRIQEQKTGILADIVQESYQDYSAVVMGQSGTSRLKDMVVGSLANKLVGKIKHMPLVIVSGKSTSDKILVGLDHSIEAKRVVSSIAELTGATNPKITLCHALKLPGMFHFSTGNLTLSEKEQDWLEYQKKEFMPCMDEAKNRLQEAGVAPSNISHDFIALRGDPVQRIIQKTYEEKVGTIAVGRRDAVSFAEAHFRGRFSGKIIKMLEDMAVWIVS